MARGTRTNISVPVELKARMDAVDEPVNWSAVACAAFEQRLAEIITRKGAKDMEDVIARLKASKQKTDSEIRKLGLGDGRRWATNKAEAVELERLAESEEGEAPIASDHSHRTPGETFVGVIAGGNLDDVEYGDFGTEHFGDGDWRVGVGRASDPEYIGGFIEGALEVWDEVKDQL